MLCSLQYLSIKRGRSTYIWATSLRARTTHCTNFPPPTAITQMGALTWSRQECVDRARAFARRGFVAISIEYRCERGVGGSSLWTDAVADARIAVQWVSLHAASLGIDPTRIVAFGSSAGAITVAGMIYFAPSPSHTELTVISDLPRAVAATVAPRVVAAASLRAGVSVSGCLFNDTTSLPPGRHVWNHLYASAGPQSAPFMDMHGTADPIVPYSNASARPSTEGRRNESCSATDTRG